MSKTFHAASDSLVARLASDPRISDKARREAAREAARRRRTTNHCPAGTRCSNWDCERSHS